MTRFGSQIGINTFYRMKKSVFLGVSMVACLFFAKCGHTDRDGFVQMKPGVDSLTVASAQMSDWTRAGDKAVVYSRQADTNFTVYSLPGFDSLYSFNAEYDKENGSSTTGIVPGVAGQKNLYVLDFLGRNLSCFQLEADSARMLAFYEDAPELVYVNGMAVSDTLVLLGTMNFLEKSFRLSLMDLHGWQTVQELDSKTFVNNMYNPVNYPLLAGNRDNVALVYKDYKRIEYYSLSSEGRLSFRKAVGKEYDKEGVEALKKAATDLDGPVAVGSGEKYLYLLENAVDFKGEIIGSRVEVFDWQGNGLYRLQFYRPATRLMVDEANGKIYTFNELENGGKIYVYDISSILGE